MYSSEEFEEVSETKENPLKTFYNNNKLLIWVFIAVLLIVVAFMVLRKGGNTNYSMSIKPDGAVVVAPGKNYQLEARLNNDKTNAIWASSDDSILTVDNSGNVTAVSYGQAIVTATINKNNKKYDAKKSVTVADGNKDTPVTSVNVKSESITMKINDTANIDLEITPSDGYVFSKKIVSSNENVARVTSAGVIESISAGQTNITIDINGTFKKVIKVVVNNGDDTNPSSSDTKKDDTKKDETSSKTINVTDLQLSVTALYFEVGRSQLIAPVIVPGDATDKSITCESGNSAIVKVEVNSDKMSCLATAVSSGSTIITIKSNSGNVTKTLSARVK